MYSTSASASEKRENSNSNFLPVLSLSTKPPINVLKTTPKTPILSEVTQMSNFYSRISSLMEPGQISRNCKELQKEFSQMKTDELSLLLNSYFDEVVAKNNQSKGQDPVKIMQELSEIIPFEKLQEVIKKQYPDFNDAVETAKKMLGDAEEFLAKTKTRIPPGIHLRLSNIIQQFFSLLENLTSTFGIADMFKQSDTEYQSEMRSMKLFSIISLYSMLSAMLIPFIGVAGAAIMIGGGLLTLSVLSFIYPLVRSKAQCLPKAINISQQYRDGKLNVEGGRDKAKYEISKALEIVDGQSTQRYPTLIGSTGVGKTQTILDFVADIENGKFPQYKGMDVHYIKTVDLITPASKHEGGTNKILNKISEVMGRHRNKFILVFDEIHLAFKPENIYLGEQLKALFSKNDSENFPYAIGITTDEEFYKYIFANNSAFARRCNKITIENTDEFETSQILKNSYFKQAPKIILENGTETLKSIFVKTTEAFGKEAVQPATSLNILTECVKRVGESQKSEREVKIEKLNVKIDYLKTKRSAAQGEAILPYKISDSQELANLEREMKVLKTEIQDDEMRISQVFQEGKKLFEVKEGLYKTVVKVSKLSKEKLSLRDKAQLSEFLLISHYLAPKLLKKVHDRSLSLGVNMVIDSKLIDDVIKKEKLNKEKAEAAIKNGQSKLESRTGKTTDQKETKTGQMDPYADD